MRVPKTYHFDTSEKISRVHLDAPILIPRLPVVTNDKQRTKLIKSIETYVRTSLEYKDLIKYLKTYIDMNQCEFFQKFDGTQKPGLIQIHHEPFDLFSITQIVMNKQEKELGYINELEVATEVMRLHYRGLVGLIPLSVTAHELVHDGKLIVPLNSVYGKFVQFVKEYYDYIDDTLLLMLNQKIEQTKNLKAEDMSILAVRYIYTDVDGYKLPQLIES